MTKAEKWINGGPYIKSVDPCDAFAAVVDSYGRCVINDNCSKIAIEKYDIKPFAHWLIDTFCTEVEE